MNKRPATLIAAIAAATLSSIASAPATAAAVVLSDSGAEVSDLSGPADPLAAFRAALGANLGGVPNPGLLPGRREINWDAGAPLDPVADPALMPADQFNRAAGPFARGAQFSTPGTGFFLSRRCAQDGGAPPCGGSNILFGHGPGTGTNVNFRAFSEERIFSPLNGNTMDVTFAVPGSPGVAATTDAFGAIFLDVEVADLTSMEFFDLGGSSLGLFAVPAAGDSGFSFLGVRFDAGERVARVRLTLGDMLLTGHGTTGTVLSDLVALDDFIYAEPSAVRIGEPATLALVGLAGLVAGARRRRAA